MVDYSNGMNAQILENKFEYVMIIKQKYITLVFFRYHMTN